MTIKLIASSVMVAVMAASSASAQRNNAEVQLEARAEAVRNFAVTAYKAIHAFTPSLANGSMDDRARYFTDVDAYRGYLSGMQDTIKQLTASGATLSAEIVGEPSSSALDPSMTEWKARFKAREQTIDRKGQTDRCIQVELTIVAAGDLPLGDSYSIKGVSERPSPDADCSIVAATPIDKETLRLELINRQNSLGGFLQSASATMFSLDYTEEEPQYRRSVRFFSNESGFDTYRVAVGNLGMFPFLKHNKMISTGTFMGNLTFEKSEDDGLWHTAFYVKQRFVEPGFDLSRCIGIAAEVQELPAQFGGAEYAIKGISMHPMEDDSACESGKELTAAMWNLINTARESSVAREDAASEAEGPE
ncbi:hypothetical protein G6L37_05300 [Agrobacterium rubi]|nr:hypothetical protein [Agrobacterium rubi]NTF24773.1 hypothetical protein [Agrobacterium rubi]